MWRQTEATIQRKYVGKSGIKGPSHWFHVEDRRRERLEERQNLLFTSSGGRLNKLFHDMTNLEN